MKAELLWLPIVGWKAVLAKDIFVHRQTQSSFLRLLRSTTSSLKAGNSIMTFPGKARDFLCCGDEENVMIALESMYFSP